jgi:4-amino-4-deoxy-L-arabinose transferase-like glycosyltransferase
MLRIGGTGVQSDNMNMNRTFLLLCAVAAFALFFALGHGDIVKDNEGQRATPPAEMLRTGDFVVPTMNGGLYLDKPPLLYWAIAGLYRATGVISPWTARFPTALCGFLLVIFCFIVVRREGGDRAALWTALALLTSYYFLERARWSMLDVPLSLATVVAIIYYRRGSLAKGTLIKLLALGGAGVALGAAILLKGPAPLPFLWAAWAAIALNAAPDLGRILRWGLPVSGAALLFEGGLQLAGVTIPLPVALIITLGTWSFLGLGFGGKAAWRSLGHLVAVVTVGVVVAAPWAVAVLQRMKWTSIQSLIDYQVVERTYQASEINSGSPFYYFLALPLLCFPWGLLFPLQFFPVQKVERPPLYQFSLLTGWLSVLTFSLIAGKEYEYILPAFVFILIPVGFHVAALEDGTAIWRRCNGLWIRSVHAVLLVVAIAGPVYVTMEFGVGGAFVVALVGCTCALAAFVYGLRVPNRKLSALCIMLVALLTAIFYVRDDTYQGNNSFAPAAAIAKRLVQEGYTVEISRRYPAFFFYAGVIVPIDSNVTKVKEKLMGDAPYYYLAQEKFLTLLNFDENLRQLAGPYTSKKLVLIGNRPLPR